jgi:hypothetical protein
MHFRRLLFLLFALAVTFTAGAAKLAAQDLIGLYLTWRGDPTTTMTVNWVDIYEDSSDTVWYRAFREGQEYKTAEATRGTAGPTTLVLRRVELKNLEPDTVYEFGIGDKRRDVPQFYRFRTMPAELNRPIRFVEGGDMMHSRATLDDMSEHVAEHDPDFALFGGDLAYANGVHGTRWIDWLQSWREHGVAKGGRLVPMVLCIGNHEVKHGYGGRIPDDAPYFYSLFSLPEDRSYYALDFGKYLSLVVLDSDHTQDVTGAQADWLKDALAKRREQKYLFAAYHFPAYGTEKPPKDGPSIDSARSLEIQQQWVPHFERYGLTAVFEHDHHNFKRSHRIRNRQRDDENGLLYLGDGAWGVRTRTVPEDAWWLAKAAPRNHFWGVELRSDGTAKFTAIDVDGKPFDEVTIDRPRTKAGN